VAGRGLVWPGACGCWLPFWLPPTLSVANIQRPKSQLEVLTTCQPEPLTREASLGQTATLLSQGLGPVRRHARGGPVRLPT